MPRWGSREGLGGRGVSIIRPRGGGGREGLRWGGRVRVFSNCLTFKNTFPENDFGLLA